MTEHVKNQDTDNQGEGNREAGRNYNRATREFVKSGQVEEKARAAADVDPADKDELRRAEEKGKARAKEEDPAINRDYSNANS